MDPKAGASPLVREGGQDPFAWDQARAFLRRRLEGELWKAQGADLDDLTQEACLRLVRALRRGPAENHEALMTEIARRTAIDFLRALTRRSRRTQPLDHEPEAQVDWHADPEVLGDPTARVQFVVLEFFAARQSSCRGLALAYFERRDWRLVARELGKSHAAIRKQWSRCVQALREAVQESPDSLFSILGSRTGSEP